MDHGLHVLVVVDVRLVCGQLQPPAGQLSLDLLPPLLRLRPGREEDEEIVHVPAVAAALATPLRRPGPLAQRRPELQIEPLHKAPRLPLHQVVLVRGELLLYEPVELVQVQVGQEVRVGGPLGQSQWTRLDHPGIETQLIMKVVPDRQKCPVVDCVVRNQVVQPIPVHPVVERCQIPLEIGTIHRRPEELLQLRAIAAPQLRPALKHQIVLFEVRGEAMPVAVR